MTDEKNTLEITAALTLAIDDAKRAGNLEPVRRTKEYRMMLERLDAEGKRTHEINVRHLDEVFQQSVNKLKLMTPGMRKLCEESLASFPEPEWKSDSTNLTPEPGAGKVHKFTRKIRVNCELRGRVLNFILGVRFGGQEKA
jgi:hypothetical protein